MPNNLRDDLIDILEAVSGAQLSTLRRLRRAPQEKPAASSSAPAKRMSHIDMAYDILRRAGHPLDGSLRRCATGRERSKGRLMVE